MTVPVAEPAHDHMLWLCHSSHRIQALAHGRHVQSWIYLGQSYIELLAWERGFGAGVERIAIDKLLSAAAGELRRPFLRLLVALAGRHAGLAWWTSRLAERNTMVSPLFLHCCYARVALGVIDRLDQPLCVVSESWALLRFLEVAARARGYDVRWIRRSLPGWRLALRWYTKVIRCAAEFLDERFHTLRQARRIALGIEPDKNRPCALLRTYLDDSCFSQNGTIGERFLVGVAHWLERRGYDVWTAPVLFGVRRPYAAAWRLLHNSPQKFLNPDEHYQPVDVFFTILVALRQALIPRGRICLGDLDVTALFKEERQRFAFDRGSLDAILLSRLPYRLKQAGWRIDTVVQGYENMVLEKGAITGFRCHMPDTKVIGFQHCVAPPMLLCHFVTAEEAAIAPLPDRIICNGRLFRRILIAEGLEADRVVEGPALRYAHLREDREHHDGPPCVLVALPLELGAGVELLHKVHDALGADSDLPVKLKPHPMAHPPELLQLSGLDRLPNHFEFVGGGMAEWLAAARVIVSAGSAVLFEALAAGVPTVTVGRECALNLNPLSWLDDTDPILYRPSDIRQEVQRLWHLTTAERDAYRRRGRELLSDAFNPVTDEWMHVFTDGRITKSGHDPASPVLPSIVQPKGPAEQLVDVG